MKKKNQIKGIIIVLLAIFLIIAVFSYISIKKEDSSNILTYNGYTFYLIQTGNLSLYTLSFGVGSTPKIENPKPYLHNFRYFPSDLEYIPFESKIVEKTLYSSPKNYKEKIYISVGPDFTNQEALAPFVLFQILNRADYGVFQIPTQMAFSSYYEETENPIKTCRDANNEIGVILLKKGDNEKIYIEEDCIILQGKGLEGLRKVSEKLTYMLLKVMK